MVPVQAHHETNDQSYDAGNHHQSDQTDPLPPSSASDKDMVPDVLELLSLRTGDIPEAVFWRLCPVSVPRRLSQESAAEGAIVRSVRWERRRRGMCVFVDDGQTVVERAGA